MSNPVVVLTAVVQRRTGQPPDYPVAAEGEVSQADR
jgi:hypothetical protein